MKYLKILIVIAITVVSCKEIKDESVKTNSKSIPSTISVEGKQPFLFSNGNKLFMSFTQKLNDSLHVVKFSKLENGKWTEAIEIARGDDWFVNWADFPAIVENNGNIASHFLEKSDPATFAYDVHLKVSNDNGQHWNDDFLLHTDSTKTEHGFVTILPYKEDAFFTTWLDGRNTGGGGHGDGHSSNGAMNIRTATISKTGEVIDDTLVDAKTCDCCQTSAAITPKGPIIIYRDRTDEEVRDIYISRLLDGSWTIPKSINNDNWVIDGCPVNGPKAAAINNTLAIAWFTAANNIPKVNVVFSGDSGASFDKPIQIDNGKSMGRVDIALLDENNALVSWMESTENDAEIKVMKVGKDGKKQEPIVVSTLSASRASGFPQMELVNDKVYIAWNHIEGDKVTIKVKEMHIDDFK